MGSKEAYSHRGRCRCIYRRPHEQPVAPLSIGKVRHQQGDDQKRQASHDHPPAGAVASVPSVAGHALAREAAAPLAQAVTGFVAEASPAHHSETLSLWQSCWKQSRRRPRMLGGRGGRPRRGAGRRGGGHPHAAVRRRREGGEARGRGMAPSGDQGAGPDGAGRELPRLPAPNPSLLLAGTDVTRLLSTPHPAPSHVEYTRPHST